MDQDRFSHLFTSNTMLSPFELESVRHEIEARTTTIHQLELQIGVLKAEREKYQTLLSPLRRNLLPPETLGEIFSFCIQYAANSNSSCASQLNTLCRVCRAWRAAALVKPALWATVGWFCIDAPKKIDVGKVNAWLSRSGKVNKAIQIRGDHRAGDSPECPLSPPELGNLLTDGFSLDTLSLVCTHAECLVAIFSEMQDRSSKVQSVDSLHLGMEWASSVTFGKVCGILDWIPTVRTLSLALPEFHDNFTFDSELPETLPFGNLSGLTLICDWPLPLVLDILRNCVNLETLTLDTEGCARKYDPSLPDDMPILLLPRLRALQLKGLDLSTRDTDILQYLRVPSLRTLDIIFYMINRDEPDDYNLPNLGSDIASLVTGGPNRATNLQHLRLKSLPITPQGLYVILSALPTLTHLTLEELESDSRLFRDAHTSSTKLLPRLKTLKIHEASELFTFNDSDVYNFLRRRKEGLTEESPDYLEEAELTVRKERTYLWQDAFDRPYHYASEMAKNGIRLSIGAAV
ncbi:hypothetical protein D9611_010877 [Ephemerocybe angulata]|uniref:F-box domain-containing protein n=1 Tax=Ephemerocybe angulata TaxID=980116 RepID=A0A8H5FG09_9AGAR|nr:hypothetical protein D9611_010877 [Tulosesus angulatus]